MSCAQVHVRELAGWELDDYEYRPAAFKHAKTLAIAHLLAQRSPFKQANALMVKETAELSDTLAQHATRLDLLAEMNGLAWSLGVIDIRPLIAFQRRIFFNSELPQFSLPAAKDWPALLALSFGPTKRVEYRMIQDAAIHTLILQSSNPNLHFRNTSNTVFPLSIHSGGPFFEVACFRDRWFLRDGYHRAYALLQAGVYEVPAVIVQARTINELGATQPWFFPENLLFSETPPRVLDFLNDDLVLEYERPPLIKTLRITMEETLTPANPQENNYEHRN
ncbi:hypothetical protein [Granulicella arctica]|uniref:Uncharacterized protein n=1 Tax=Granulicella arctica TaxID=940613 RepID=A0A7Y9PHP4_9BACT|nr:hypothetical protein [Granulicella arctica]NYF80041.1 hypothetical protein [Granulicella arctica]